uniref:Uncharacterized protein n=1 Tax=Athene cunicularia TaxID=194338 RepID=A0A663N6N7_ATHCN
PRLKTQYPTYWLSCTVYKPMDKVPGLSHNRKKMTAPKGSLMPISSRTEPQITLTEYFHFVATSTWEALAKTLQLLLSPRQKAIRRFGLSAACMPDNLFHQIFNIL